MNITLHPSIYWSLFFCTIIIVLWSIEIKLQLSMSYSAEEKNPYINPPQTFVEGLNQQYKAKIDRDKTGLLMGVYVPTMGLGLFNGKIIQDAIHNWYPMISNTKSFWITFISVAIYYLATFAYMKPPTFEKQYRGRFVMWCLWIYITEAIWHYMFLYGVE